MTRKLIYGIGKDIRGGYVVYGENGVRKYYCRSPAKAVKAYETQAKLEEIIAEYIIKHRVKSA